MLCIADYGQLEYRVIAHYCGKGFLWDCFQNGIDPHKVTMEAENLERANAKSANFMAIYGGGVRKAEVILGSGSEAAKAFMSRQRETFTCEQKLMRDIKTAAKQRGWVKNWFGFKRWLPDAMLVCPTHRRHEYGCDTCSSISRAERQAANMVIQGTGAGIVKRAMLLWHTECRHLGDMILQVHDEIGLRVTESKAEEAARALEWCMLEAPKRAGIKVAMEVDAKIVSNWAEAK